jgi:DNA polymerase III subunit beta
MGIFLHVADDQLKAAATDGHRLARIVLPKPDGADGMPDVIVPGNAWPSFASCSTSRRHGRSLAVADQDPLRPWQRGPDQQADRRHLPRLQPGDPDRQRQAPQARPEELFGQGVDRVSTIASEKTRAVKMSVDRDKVTLSVTSPESGTATEEVPADYGSDTIEIGFNARYLLDILEIEIEGDTVEVHLADAAAPTLLRENDKSNALYVLMPMRV